MSIFDKVSVEIIEAATKKLRDGQDELNKLYWAKHKEIAATSYDHSTDQLYDMAKLGELAKGLQELKKTTGHIFCAGIIKE